LQRRFLRKRGAAGNDEDTCGEYPFRLLTAFAATFPKGTASAVAETLRQHRKAPPWGSCRAAT